LWGACGSDTPFAPKNGTVHESYTTSRNRGAAKKYQNQNGGRSEKKT